MNLQTKIRGIAKLLNSGKLGSKDREILIKELDILMGRLTHEHFKVSGDTIVIILFMILLIAPFVSYKCGFKDGRNTEKIEWLEQKEIERMNYAEGKRIQENKG